MIYRRLAVYLLCLLLCFLVIGGRRQVGYRCNHPRIVCAPCQRPEGSCFDRGATDEPGGAKTAFTPQRVYHPAYEPLLSKVIDKLRVGGANAPSPQGIAGVIYEAATDTSDRLRYPANGGGKFLLLHGILPDALWRRMVRSAN